MSTDSERREVELSVHVEAAEMRCPVALAYAKLAVNARLKLRAADRQIEQWTNAWFVGETVCPDGSLRATLQGLMDRADAAEGKLRAAERALQLVIDADDTGKGTEMEYDFAKKFQAAARACEDALAEIRRKP